MIGGKGMLGLLLECTGKDWGRGPMKINIHSSNKSCVDSPSWRLLHALATFTTLDGNNILIDGFYDNVKHPTNFDLELVDKLIEKFDEDEFKYNLGVENFINNLHGKNLLLRYLYEPTLNLEDIIGGDSSLDQIFMHKMTVGVLCHRVTAKMQIRLVLEQSPDEILKKIRLHLDKRGYSDIKITKLYEIPPARSELQAPIIQAVLQTYRKFGIDTEIWPTQAASPPPAIFNRAFGVPFIIGGVGHGGRLGVNEYFVIRKSGCVFGLSDCEKAYVRMIYDYAQR